MTVISGNTLEWETSENSESGVYTVTVTGSGDLSTASLTKSFTLTVYSTCEYQTISPAVVSDKTYVVSTPAVVLEVPDFVNDEPVYCPLTYTVEIPPSAPWITQTATKTLSWYTDDNAYAS